MSSYINTYDEDYVMAYGEGYDAYNEGYLRNENPYTAYNISWTAWDNAWAAAEADDNEGVIQDES
jgi:hypothetical protein